mmetsp:Transcript_2692/g.9534  ORF Transcript_2692/g.9534 Transcript_2692/m.9534 type:complete len:303 (+) Transcript_2692:280-1188(+)|eukprot:CAMPEP_0114609840 /NCGR_PEP_ID=MMETSP0168-20121206/3292_1 /TAXON_ID=95228 ORGANISM="Vannella sp., Strain DIVA3 517/6/12" /NCGR_SAMPLE_ID=MMETSP0168 /ASSEMBLY_ACC=CAM_ASM_000044 /LENGTH=302 /DNA_ID=CAMNT_0001820763 /DNA_START=221 /DNA_END=1129 /DNA_ORIENTATION=-
MAATADAPTCSSIDLAECKALLSDFRSKERTVPAMRFNAEKLQWELVDPAPQPDAVPNTNLDQISFVTFNVWFSNAFFEQRAEALFRIVDSLHPHFVCLQEVTPRFVALLREQEWVQRDYYCSDAIGTTVNPYGVLMLSRLPVSRFVLHTLPTNMGRKLLVAETMVNGELFRVSTVHLESLQNPLYRKAQLGLIYPILSRGGCKHSAVMGDFNFCSESTENPTNIKNDYLDMWPTVHGLSEEAIEEGKTRVDHRLDRILVRSPSFKPSSIRKLGTEPISDATPHVFPSDHFGLFATATRQQP